jgi:ATP-binding cassette subfamily G (WHITE) protein 2 (SNQ2)
LLRSYTLQNYGIIVAFGIGFFVFLLIAAEYNTNSAFDTAVTLFKQGTHAVDVTATEDEEKASKLSVHPPSLDDRAPRTADAPAPYISLEKPAINDIFTWQHIQYTVSVSGGERRLLDDVSGYVAPGKLTALMGESGAGKVRCIFIFMTVRSIFFIIDDVAQCLGSTC